MGERERRRERGRGQFPRQWLMKENETGSAWLHTSPLSLSLSFRSPFFYSSDPPMFSFSFILLKHICVPLSNLHPSFTVTHSPHIRSSHSLQTCVRFAFIHPLEHQLLFQLFPSDTTETTPYRSFFRFVCLCSCVSTSRRCSAETGKSHPHISGCGVGRFPCFRSLELGEVTGWKCTFQM